MKKLIALFCLFSFLTLNVSLAIEDTNIQAPIEKTAKMKPVKKDPHIIKLPNRQKIDEELFEKKMAQDDKEYEKKIHVFSNDFALYRDKDGKILAKLGYKGDSEEEKEYKEMQNSWAQGYYMFYKIADKIIRANNLDTQNWRFEIRNKPDEINAYANAANHVVLYSSITDSFYDNEDALAFVIGHEMAHHILGHIQKNIKAYDRIKKLQYGINNSLLCSYLIFPLFIAPGYKIKQWVWYSRIRKNELEADSESITLLARAGYDVAHVNDVMSTFSQIGEHEKTLTDTHPNLKERMQNANNQIALLDIDTLKIEGEKNLYEKPILTLKRSSDKKTIVLVSNKNRGFVNYFKDTPQQQIIYKAYSAYLNDDMKTSAQLFEQAYKTDKKNYIPCLYLSYIYEYNYKLNKDEKSLKQAKQWANRAYRKNNTDKYTLKQKMDIKLL